MCPRCDHEPLQYLQVLSDGRVWTAAPGRRIRVDNARRDYPGGIIPEGVPVDRYGWNLPSEEVGHNGAIQLTCRRCFFTRPVSRERIEAKAREAARTGIERLAVTAVGEMKPFTALTPADRRRQRAPQVSRAE
jgi:hypothetical protein